MSAEGSTRTPGASLWSAAIATGAARRNAPAPTRPMSRPKRASLRLPRMVPPVPSKKRHFLARALPGRQVARATNRSEVPPYANEVEPRVEGQVNDRERRDPDEDEPPLDRED